jgi:hypothetical protein
MLKNIVCLRLAKPHPTLLGSYGPFSEYRAIRIVHSFFPTPMAESAAGEAQLKFPVREARCEHCIAQN